MSKGKGREIDLLFEDPPISGQKYALVSIVGPHMNQKCDVWGMKVRATADTLEKAKAITKKIMRVDQEYDIYTVEVGKFFPLAVEPHAVADIEYQNEQLNVLVKNYLENREQANEQWQERKQKMMKEAIREGKAQDALLAKKEHPVAVLQRVKQYEDKLQALKEEMESLQDDIKLSQDKFDQYTDEERLQADEELKRAVESNVEPSIPAVDDDSETIVPINSLPVRDPIQDATEALQKIDLEIEELNSSLSSINPAASPNVHKRLSDQLSKLKEDRVKTVETLNNKSMVNEYINKSFGNSEYDFLQSNV